MRARRVAVVVALLCAIVALVPTPGTGAVTQQLTWWDQPVTHTATSFFEPAQSAATPSSWTSPVAWANGRVLTRIEITAKPSAKPVDIQICVWRNSFAEESCSTQLLRVATTGTHYKDFGVPAQWWKRGGTFSWAAPVSPVRLMVKDPDTGLLLQTGSCGTHCSTPEAVAGHVPIHADVAAVVVAPGATLAPPADWVGCPTAWSPDCATLAPLPAASLVVGNPTAPVDGDMTVRNRLAARGFAVTFVDDDALASGSLGTPNLVVISSSVTPSKVPTSLASLAVPILNLEAYAQYTLRLATSPAEQASQTSLSILDAAHPLAAGLSGTVAVQSSAAMGKANPVAGAARIASFPGSASPSLYGIESGTALAAGAGPAPARRVGFFTSLPSQSKLTSAGWSLFDAAASWLTGSTPPPPTTTTTTTSTTSTTAPPTTTTTSVPDGDDDAALIVGDASSAAVGDAPLRDRLVGLGYGVTLVDDDALTSAAALGDPDLVVVSSSVVPSKIPSWLASVPVPILNAEAYVQYTLRLATSPAEQASQTSLTILTPGHPLAAGLSGTVAVQAAAPMGKANPVSGAIRIASMPGTSSPSLYGIEAGTALTAGTAPARRVGFFTSYASQSKLNGAGWALFDAAVGWLASA
jgi:hypothetical protein